MHSCSVEIVCVREKRHRCDSVEIVCVRVKRCHCDSVGAAQGCGGARSFKSHLSAQKRAFVGVCRGRAVRVYVCVKCLCLVVRCSTGV